MMTTASPAVSPAAVWLGRLRFVVATALLWAGLHYLVGWTLPRGVDRPLVLSSSVYGPLAGVLVIVVLWAGTALASWLARPRGRGAALFMVGLALALWAAEGGRRGVTMDDWLIRCNVNPGAPTGTPYWGLLADYVYLLVAVAGANVIAAWFHGSGEPPAVGGLLRRAFALGASPDERRRRLAALVATVVVAGVATLILMGPPLAATYRGQVYFAVGIGLFAGVFVARRVMKASELTWFWLAPFLLGIVGLLVAGLRPYLMLPPEYQHINVIPAWGLARALPVEMVGVGLVGAFWMLRGPPEAAPGPGG